jgi:PAS domain S-box-containing protein
MNRDHLRDLARAAAGGQTPDLQGLSAHDVEILIHEFGVYQMELEAQNEELRKTRLALEETRDRYRELYDFAPVGYFTLSRSGEILEANLTGCTLLGSTRRELLGRHLSEFLDRQGGDDLYRHLGKVLETIEAQNEEVLLLHEGDQERWLRLESVAARDGGGQPVCRTAVTDVTDRKRAEKAQAAAMQTAEEASRAKSEFLANMSHEIRTPMTVFMAAVEHLLQREADPQRQQLLDLANQSARRLSVLIDDILDFSRIEARKLILEEKSFDLREHVRSTVEMLAMQAGDKQLQLNMAIAPEIPARVIGDASRLEQILTNLIGNAIKFTNQGEVQVSVQLQGDRLEFLVSDTGFGIPAEQREVLFESFTQADSSFKRRFGGSGLGLAISKGLVQLMGGTIGVRGREGQGSVFFFNLPFKRGEEQAPERQEKVAENVSNGIRILLAEDEPMIRQMLQMSLAKRGLHAEMAENGSEAVRKWEEQADEKRPSAALPSSFGTAA